ncbi:MAG: hypothetical protein RMM06_00455 [Armatimonadota bacterium]|nr:hypothetical protein [Armatimonadota bacterium]
MRTVVIMVWLSLLALCTQGQPLVSAHPIPPQYVTVRPAKLGLGEVSLSLRIQELSPQQLSLIYDNFPNDDPAPHLFYYDATGNGDGVGRNWWVDYDNVGAGGEVRSFEFSAGVTQNNARIRVYFFRNVTPTRAPSVNNLIPLKNSSGFAVFDITAPNRGYYTFTVTLPPSLYFNVSGDIGWSVVKPRESTGLYDVTWDFNAPIGRRDAYLSVDGGSTWELIEFYGHPVANFTLRLQGIPVRTNTTLFGNLDLDGFEMAVQPPKEEGQPENDAFLPTLEVELRQPGTTNAVRTFYLTPYATEQQIDPHTTIHRYSYLLPVVPTGTYDVAFRANHWLRKVVPNVTIGGVTMLDVALLNGDINGNNEVDLLDFGELIAAYGSTSGEPQWNFQTDLDGDLEVGLLDFSILLRNFGLFGDE